MDKRGVEIVGTGRGDDERVPEMTDNQQNQLKEYVKFYESLGCRKCSLGFVDMPDGYALMLDRDESHYFWLRWDGCESVNHWNRWAIYRMAKNVSYILAA